MQAGNATRDNGGSTDSAEPRGVFRSVTVRSKTGRVSVQGCVVVVCERVTVLEMEDGSTVTFANGELGSALTESAGRFQR